MGTPRPCTSAVRTPSTPRERWSARATSRRRPSRSWPTCARRWRRAVRDPSTSSSGTSISSRGNRCRQASPRSGTLGPRCPTRRLLRGCSSLVLRIPTSWWRWTPSLSCRSTAMTGGKTVRPNEITEVLNRPLSQELLARDLTRLAYVAKDGTPRNVPIIFTWNGSQIVMCTPKNAPKLRALGENPTVALTIDTEVHPPKILLIRGRAELDFVDGIPDEYLQATSTYEMTPEQRVGWEAEVRSLYHDGMVRIVVTPN